MKNTILSYICWCWVALLIGSIFCPARAFNAEKAGSPPTEIVTVTTAWSVDRTHAGDTPALAVILEIKAGFHINADQSQIKTPDNFKPVPTRLDISQVSEGVLASTARFPEAHPVTFDFSKGELMCFSGQTVIVLPVKLPENFSADTVRLKLELEYQACSASYCLFPQKKELLASLPVVSADEPVRPIHQELFADFEQRAQTLKSEAVSFDVFGWSFTLNASSPIGMLLLLLTAALGGLLLNFTPCVLPLLPIKIISISQAAVHKRRCLALGIATFAGVLFFWLVLGAFITLLSGFSATNQLFHYPLFTLTVGVVIAVMSIGMFGGFSVRLPNFVYMLNPGQETLSGSFAIGILAAVLSTPCTAPFMGAAAAWAATQQALIILLTFSAIGTGMALPYLCLSAAPRLLDRLPKAGPGSVLIKEVMAWFMLAAAAYFVGIGLSSWFTRPPAPPSKIYWWPVMALCAAAGGWLACRMLRMDATKFVKTMFVGAGILLIALSAYGGIRLTNEGPIEWVYYPSERFNQTRESRRVMVMVFTAEWCLNCKALEQGVLKKPKVVELLAQEDIVPVKVDITGKNAAGKARLNKAGSLTIPLLVVYAPDETIVFKSDFYTADQIVQAVREAKKRAGG